MPFIDPLNDPIDLQDPRNTPARPGEEQVAEYKGRWYIRMGQPGYNTRANNRDGYASKAKALAAVAKYTR
jgi:hypothetical protein